MDYHKLQKKLFEIEPTSFAEDKAKLMAQLNGNNVGKVDNPTPIVESYEVAQGSLQLDKDYSISDFAALAGVITEGKQRTGSAGQAKGSDPMPKMSKPSHTGEQPHPLKDKLVGEQEEDRITSLERRIEALEAMLEAQMTKPVIKPRDPNWKDMDAIRKSGAAGAHKDKKKEVKSGKLKHKGQQYESLKDELWARLNAKTS